MHCHGALCSQCDDLRIAHANEKERADADRTTLSRQLFTVSTQLSEALTTVQKLESDLLQVTVEEMRLSAKDACLLTVAWLWCLRARWTSGGPSMTRCSRACGRCDGREGPLRCDSIA